MPCVVMLFLLIIVAGIWKLVQSAAGPKIVSWADSVTVPLPLEQCRRALELFYLGTGCKRLKNVEAGDFYRRGNPAVDRLPMPREVTWLEIPLVIGVGCGRTPKGTYIYVEYRSPDGLRLTRAASNYIRQGAATEFATARRWLESSRDRADEYRHERFDDARDAPSEDAESALDDDLALLGLKRGATWPDVQTAYRQHSRKFHPDQLTAQGVPPHLVELAVQRFKEVTSAYQRLKERMATAGARG